MSRMKVYVENTTSLEKYFGVNIYLDNNYLGKLHANDTIEVEILPGKHTIYASSLFIKSKKINFKVDKQNRLFEVCNHSLPSTIIQHEDIIGLIQRMA